MAFTPPSAAMHLALEGNSLQPSSQLDRLLQAKSLRFPTSQPCIGNVTDLLGTRIGDAYSSSHLRVLLLANQRAEQMRKLEKLILLKQMQAKALERKMVMMQMTHERAISSSLSCTSQPVVSSMETVKALGMTQRNKGEAYIDVAHVQLSREENEEARRTRGGVAEPFPEKVHRILEDCARNGQEDICSFAPHGRSFRIHDPDRFSTVLMPKYFKKQPKVSSFVRQLNLYGFQRVQSGPDAGSYYHELFLRGNVPMSWYMRRVATPARKKEDRRRSPMRLAGLASTDPNFYDMPALPKSG